MGPCPTSCCPLCPEMQRVQRVSPPTLSAAAPHLVLITPAVTAYAPAQMSTHMYMSVGVMQVLVLGANLCPGEAWDISQPSLIDRHARQRALPPSLHSLRSTVLQGEGAIHPKHPPAAVLQSVLLPHAIPAIVHILVLRQTNTKQTKTNRQTNRQTTRQTDRQSTNKRQRQHARRYQ